MIKFETYKDRIRVIMLCVLTSTFLTLSALYYNLLPTSSALIISFTACITLLFISVYGISINNSNDRIEEQSKVIDNHHEILKSLHNKLKEITIVVEIKNKEIEDLSNLINYQMEVICKAEEVLKQETGKRNNDKFIINKNKKKLIDSELIWHK